jgi:predicted nucleotidyltransferase
MAFFALERELTALLGRPVDLAEPGGLRNPIVRDSVLSRRVPVYAAA